MCNLCSYRGLKSKGVTVLTRQVVVKNEDGTEAVHNNVVCDCDGVAQVPIDSLTETRVASSH